MEINLGRLVDALPGLMWTATPDGGAEIVGKRWLEYTGLTAAEAAGSGWGQAVHPEDGPRLTAQWAAIIESGRPGEVEARLRRFDGAYRWFLFRACPFPDEQGRVARWCGINIDIEDRISAEDMAREHQRRFEHIVDGLPAMVALFAPDGQITFANKHMLDYHGQTLEQLQRGPGAYTYHPDDQAEVLRRWRTSVGTGEPFDCGARLLRADGAYRWHRVRGFPVRDRDGRIALWYGLFTDTDDAERALASLSHTEAELRRAYGFLTEAQRLSKTGSFAWDAQAEEETWSEELYRIFEIDPGTKITLDVVRERIHPEDLPLLRDTTERALRGEETDYFFRIVTPRGAVKHLHAVAHRSQQATDRPVFMGAIQDVTESKVAEEALGRARAELAHMARAMTFSALTASIAHEVNQPLAGIITNANTCLRMLAGDSPNLDGARATAERTIRDANRAAEVIRRLRAMFARKQPTMEPVDLNDAAREVLALLSDELQRARVIVRTDLDARLPAVRGDRVQLQQVMVNLVRNAADAMSEVHDRARELWVASAPEDADWARLSVRDSGMGFDPESAGRLFDPFYTTKGDGMGIGLAISRSIIESHAGRLWASPNRGPGATFTFSIPCGAANT